MTRADCYPRLRAILQSTRCVVPASVYDPLSARVAEDVGFELAMFAGSTASLAVLGAPDIVLVTLTEFCEQARRICRASRLPLLVDADHGYGNALNVMRCVGELRAAGVTALTIEDTNLPKAFREGRSGLVSVDEALGKLCAALEARGTSDIAIIARVNTGAVRDFSEAVERARAYSETGVDALFLSGLKRREQLDEIARVVHIPMVIGSATGELSDLDYLAARGVRIGLTGHHPVMAAIQAIHATMTALRNGVAPADLTGTAPAELVARITRQDQYDVWSQRYLGSPGRRSS